MLRIWRDEEAQNEEEHLLQPSVIPKQIKYGVDSSRMDKFLIDDFYSDHGTHSNDLF